MPIGSQRRRVSTYAPASRTPASKTIAIAPSAVACGLRRWMPPNRSDETASAVHVPPHSSTRRKTTPRKTISSIVPAAIADSSASTTGSGSPRPTTRYAPTSARIAIDAANAQRPRTTPAKSSRPPPGTPSSTSPRRSNRRTYVRYASQPRTVAIAVERSAVASVPIRGCTAQIAICAISTGTTNASAIPSRASGGRRRAFVVVMSLHSEQLVDPSRVAAERLVRLQVERARVRQLDREVVGHPGRPGGEDDDARAEEDRLGDAVGDEEDRLARFLPDPEQLEVHLLARQRIERAERLVHQHELGIVDERARDARCCMPPESSYGRLSSAPARPTSASSARARSRLSFAGRPRISAGRTTLSRIVRHFSSSGAWNTMPMSRLGSDGTAAEPIFTVPASCGWSPARIFKSVLLPHPDGPTRQASSPGRTSNVASEIARCARAPVP